MRAEHHGMDYFIIFNSEEELLDLTTDRLQIPWQELRKSTGSPLRTGNGELRTNIDIGERTMEIVLQTANGNSRTPSVSYDSPAQPKKATMTIPIDVLRHVDLLHTYACPYGKGDGMVRFSFAPQQP